MERGSGGGIGVYPGAVETAGRYLDMDAELAVDSATAARPRGDEAVVLHAVSRRMQGAGTHGRGLASGNFGR